ncbi:MAG: aminoacyl-tRNA hydrolase [Phycisphaerales bacterium]|nr:aminoacyl-tRNA hydrolase [Phycisphaerales bacterium]
MKLIVGLGNPGPEYDRTRHNVGFEVVDRLARRYGSDTVARARFHGALVEGTVGTERVLLLKPLTFMNRSGQAVAEAARFYRIELEDVLVIVDDVALPCGQLRMRAGGSAGGHNGLADIEQKLGSDQYPRLRLGIDPPGPIPQKSYVLGKFSPDQQDRIAPALDAAADAAACWTTDGITEAMNQFNRTLTA